MNGLNYIFYLDECNEQDEEIKVGKNTVKLSIIKSILSNEYFNEIYGLFFRKVSRISFCLKSNKVCVGSYSLSTLSQALTKVLELNISDNLKKRIKSLISLNDFNAFIADYHDKKISSIIDGEEYNLSYQDIISFLLLDDKEYQKAIKRKYFQNNKTEILAFMIKMMHLNDRVTDKYVFPLSIKKRIRDIVSSKDIDIEALNEINETNSYWLDKTIIDKEFEEAILKSIPNNMKLMEKTIYLYILLCRVLSYDPFFFGFDADSTLNLKHKYIEYLSTIKKNNNYIVCYEYSSLFGYFLHKLGVDFEILSIENLYQSHELVTYRIGKYIVSADAVTSVLSGDLVRCKVGFPIIGLQITNMNVQTQKEFQKMVESVYSMFEMERHDFDFYDDMSMLDKLEEMIRYVNKFHLDIMDKYSFMYLLKRRIFTKDELENFSYVILNNNKSLIGVFTIVIDGEYHYYLYEYNYALREVDASDLQERLNSQIYSYVPDSLERIPFKEKVFIKRKRNN